MIGSLRWGSSDGRAEKACRCSSLFRSLSRMAGSENGGKTNFFISLPNLKPSFVRFKRTNYYIGEEPNSKNARASNYQYKMIK